MIIIRADMEYFSTMIELRGGKGGGEGLKFQGSEIGIVDCVKREGRWDSSMRMRARNFGATAEVARSALT